MNYHIGRITDGIAFDNQSVWTGQVSKMLVAFFIFLQQTDHAGLEPGWSAW